MIRGAVVVAAVSSLICLGLVASAGAANPTSLLVSQSAAFSILGHSCGGIQEQAYATGFDTASGYPVGDVYLSTRCGGSGRGGGYHTTTYSAWVAVTWDWSGTALSTTKLSTAPSVDPNFSAFDSHGDQVYNVSGHAYLNVVVPAAPTGVTATPAGGQFSIAWVPDPAAAAQINSSLVTATPVGSTAPVVTAAVTGNATSVLIGPLQPQTTYQVTVVNTDSGGSSPPSNAISLVTAASSIVPSAPTGVSARWTAPGAPGDTLLASWAAAAPGDSPTDQYQITITGSDGGGTFTQTVSGSTLTVTFNVSDVPDWTVKVRAHDAAGWGAWSARFVLGGA
jgi:hypothetical protein